MVVYRKSVKVVASKEDILKYIPKKGIDVLWQPVKFNSSLYIVTLSCSSISGVYKDDIDEELTKLNVLSDRIRDPNEVRKIPKNANTVEANINDQIFRKNKEYEDLLSIVEKNFKNTIHQSSDGKQVIAKVDEG